MFKFTNQFGDTITAEINGAEVWVTHSDAGPEPRSVRYAHALGIVGAMAGLSLVLSPAETLFVMAVLTEARERAAEKARG